MPQNRNGVKASMKAKKSPPLPSPPLPSPSSSTSPDQPQVYDDGTNTFFWQAHTVTALVIIVCGLVYTTFIEETPLDTGYNMRRGAIAVVVVFILIGVIHMPNGPFVRPHPVLWRLVLCLSILYVLMLIFVLFQSIDDTRQFLRYIDPELGRPLPERSYAEDCRIYTPDNPKGSFANVIDKIDVFVPCHFFGWWVKALVLRDFWLLTIVSVGFELLEYTFECQLPNFGECWWDHWIMDFVICNGLGIWLGIKTCEYLEMKTYEWHGLWKTPTLKGKLKRAVSQFTPYSWTSFQWGYTESFKRFFVISGMTFFWLIQELNTFYLKAVLWIPPNHALNLYREIFYAFCAACATKEMYDYLGSSDSNARVGRFSWLIATALIIETMLEIKFGWDIVTIPVPFYIKLAWATLFSTFVLWTFWHFTVPFRDMPFIGKYFQRLEGKGKED